ncbi:MAG: BLUF domain-containing protein, partial [Maribacter arcticus]|uniref:BLUF domain-containing protein n=2 Tax=Maribacter arcticus TaxID=561365 RepID=UPI00300219B7
FNSYLHFPIHYLIDPVNTTTSNNISIVKISFFCQSRIIKLEMYTLTHESTATNTVKGAEMEELLEKARSNNQNDDITGYLIYYKGGFVQLFEGDKRKIEVLYVKIKKDELHKNVTLFSEDEISKRTFPN